MLLLLQRLLLIATLLIFALPVAAADAPEQTKLAQESMRVLRDIQAVPESGIPDRLLSEARGILVIPEALKVGFVFGGRRGHGLLSVRNEDGTWSNPAFVRLTGGSIGLQAGVQKADLVFVFRSDKGLQDIVAGKLTVGADASVAAGPVGRDASANTDRHGSADMWSWSRARGLFAGVALNGAVIAMDDAANQAMYGAGSTPRMIFEQRTTQRAPDVLVDFRDALEEATSTAYNRRTLERDRGADIDRAVEAAERGETPPAATPPAAGVAATPATHSDAPKPAAEAAPATTEAAVTTEALPESAKPAAKPAAKPVALPAKPQPGRG